MSLYFNLNQIKNFNVQKEILNNLNNKTRQKNLNLIDQIEKVINDNQSV